MRATFENSVDILVKAFMNGTLEQSNCCACAVGNLIAHNCGYTFKDGGSYKEWVESPYPNSFNGGWFPNVIFGRKTREGKKQIASTGYTRDELYKIENAFELKGTNHIVHGFGTDETRFNGLMAVVDVLAIIHNIDLSTKEEAKLLFTKASI